VAGAAGAAFFASFLSPLASYSNGSGNYSDCFGPGCLEPDLSSSS